MFIYQQAINRRGHGAQTAFLPPKQIHLTIFLSSFATNVPQNVTSGGTNQLQLHVTFYFCTHYSHYTVMCF